MLIDKEYCRKGAIDVKKLFKFEDITKEVNEYLPTVPPALKEFREMLSKKKAPDIDIGPRLRKKPYECDFIEHCWAHIYQIIPFLFNQGELEEKNRAI